MSVIAVVVAVVILAALSVLQILVAAGRPYGRLVWGGQHRVLPARLRIGSVVAVLIYVAFAVVLFWRAGMTWPPNAFADIATWVMFAYFVLGIVLNAISRSRPERLVATPACAVLAVCTFIVAIG